MEGAHALSRHPELDQVEPGSVRIRDVGVDEPRKVPDGWRVVFPTTLVRDQGHPEDSREQDRPHVEAVVVVDELHTGLPRQPTQSRHVRQDHGRNVENRDGTGQEANRQPRMPHRPVKKKCERLDGLQAVGPRNQPRGEVWPQHSCHVFALSGARQDDVGGIALPVEMGEERAQADQRSRHPDLFSMKRTLRG